jgi:hypothetical protein
VTGTFARGDQPLILLTIANLKNPFPENRSLHYLLDADFRSDGELVAQDDFRKAYKIKYFYD